MSFRYDDVLIRCFQCGEISECDLGFGIPHIKPKRYDLRCRTTTPNEIGFWNAYAQRTLGGTHANNNIHLRACSFIRFNSIPHPISLNCSQGGRGGAYKQATLPIPLSTSSPSNCLPVPSSHHFQLGGDFDFRRRIPTRHNPTRRASGLSRRGGFRRGPNPDVAKS